MHCSVANENCKAPCEGGFDGPAHTNARCFRCGEPVCTDEGCSTVRPFEHFGKKRICANCDDN